MARPNRSWRLKFIKRDFLCWSSQISVLWYSLWTKAKSHRDRYWLEWTKQEEAVNCVWQQSLLLAACYFLRILPVFAGSFLSASVLPLQSLTSSGLFVSHCLSIPSVNLFRIFAGSNQCQQCALEHLLGDPSTTPGFLSTVDVNAHLHPPISIYIYIYIYIYISKVSALTHAFRVRSATALGV